MKKFHRVLLISLVVLMCCERKDAYDLMDVQGNEYALKGYGKTLWMIENLRTKLDQFGKPIKYYYPNDDSTLVDTYGLLYDFETACKICPRGWTLPTNDDWNNLLEFNGGYFASKYKDPDFWEGDLNTNSSLFSVLPTGSGNNGEYSNHFGTRTLFWSKTKEDDHFVWTYILELDKDSVRAASQHPTYAFSVRCVKAKI